MTSTKSPDEIAKIISAALLMRTLRRPDAPEDNPLHSKGVADLMHGAGILKSADHYPALDMAVKGAYGMEEVRRAGLTAGKIDRSQKRKAANRARAARKKQLDDIAASPVKPDPERLKAAWEVVLPLEPVIRRGALAKKAWASRFLGSSADDLPNMTIESCVLVLAKTDQDLDLLAKAAQELGGQLKASGRMPGDQVSDAERKERREMAKARKWLMGLVNNRIMGALVDSYTSQQNLRWDNIDLIATVMASISGPDDDAYINRHKADRAPAFLGTKMAAPGKIDGNLLATMVSAAITDRRLDPLVELLLDEERVRTDGAFAWAENAEAVFMVSPEGGYDLWSLVCRATEGLANPRRARADAARTHVRNQFEWLPGFIVSAVDTFDFHGVEWRSWGGRFLDTPAPAKATVTLSEEVPWTQRLRDIEGRPVPGGDVWTGVRTRCWDVEVTRPVGQSVGRQGYSGPRAILASAFEAYGCRGDVQIARPALAFATPAEAARAIAEHLAVLATGEELVSSVVFA